MTATQPRTRKTAKAPGAARLPRLLAEYDSACAEWHRIQDDNSIRDHRDAHERVRLASIALSTAIAPAQAAILDGRVIVGIFQDESICDASNALEYIAVFSAEKFLHLDAPPQS